MMKVVSLFSGAGGMDLGFERAGFSTVLAVEKDPACCNTLRTNRKSWDVWQQDIANVSGQDILERVSMERGELPVLIGGPPCQSFSQAGAKQGLRDSRGQMVFHFLRLVKECLPMAFVMENVQGMGSWDGGRALREVIREVEEDGLYKVQHAVLRAEDYGVPQKRRRLFLVGNRVRRGFAFPEATHSTPKTAWDAIGSLPPAGRRPHNHEATQHNAASIAKMRSVPIGGRLSDKTKAYRSSYHRLDPNKPSPTVTRGGFRDFIHPYEDRMLTVRERACLQSFPKTWRFVGVRISSFSSKRDEAMCQYAQVGNAVPPLLARAVAQALKSQVFEEEEK